MDSIARPTMSVLDTSFIVYLEVEEILLELNSSKTFAY